MSVMRLNSPALRELMNTDQKSSTIRLCLISREIKQERRFQRLTRLEIKIGHSLNGSDIHCYVVSELEKLKEDLYPEVLLSDEYINGIAKRLTD